MAVGDPANGASRISSRMGIGTFHGRTREFTGASNIKSLFGNFRVDFRAHLRERMRLFRDDSAIRFLYRF